MKMPEIKEKAKELGITPGKMKKTDLIHAIQEQEGNFPCFQNQEGECSQWECCWRTECLSS